MICPNKNCQIAINGNPKYCPKCATTLGISQSNFSLPSPQTIKRPTNQPNQQDVTTVQMRTLTCTWCTETIKISVLDTLCPQCHNLIEPISDNSIAPRTPPSALVKTMPTSATQFDGVNLTDGIEGRVERVISLQSEPIDREPLKLMIAGLLMFELIGLVLITSFYWLFTIVIVFILAAILRSGLLGFLGGCLMQTIGLPFRILAQLFRPLFDAIMPSRNPINLREVREFRIRSSRDTVESFVVKGNLAPRMLVDNDYVRIQVKIRNGRPFFAGGELKDPGNGQWQLLVLSEARHGTAWLIGFVAFNIFLAFAYIWLGGVR